MAIKGRVLQAGLVPYMQMRIDNWKVGHVEP
jgi:hypothetical protein